MVTFLADLHLGTKLKNIDYLKALDSFLGKIKEHKEECQCIFVCGDTFDHKLSISEASFASLFLLNLVCNRCGRNGRLHVPVHFIHGTYTHDYDQYDIFIPLLTKIDNTEVFYTKETCIGKLHNGMKVLYLPQLYGNALQYNPYFEQEYDIIVGHGPMSSMSNSPCQASHSEIMHSTDLLGDISKICVFGHYHGFTDFGKNVYYAGPLLRWQYGEDIQRVFLFCNDDFTVDIVNNECAIEYKTIKIDNPEQLRDMISEDIQTPHRFVINTDNTDLDTYHSIMNINKKNTNISYKISTIKHPEIVGVIDNIDEEEKPLSTQSDSLGPIDSLVMYITDKYNIDTEKEIKLYADKLMKNEMKDE